MNRNDLRRLARIRLREAKALIESSCFDGAYYLCGYAVECAIKACIAKGTKRHDFPDKARANDSFQHKPAKLIEVAGLKAPLDGEIARDPEFAANWRIVSGWSEETRYRLNSEGEAREYFRAVTARKNGVMRWLRRHW